MSVVNPSPTTDGGTGSTYRPSSGAGSRGRGSRALSSVPRLPFMVRPGGDQGVLQANASRFGDAAG